MRHFINEAKDQFSILTWRVRLVFWSGAILIGAVCAGFAIVSEHANQTFQYLASHWPWLPFILTPGALVAILWATRNWFPGAQGSGIPQAIAALQVEERSSLLSIRIAIGKILLTTLGLVCGASIGREGPSVHIGASLMHSLGRFAHFPAHYMERGLILAGGAAGIAAAFNTPMAGIVFAIEEMSKSFEQRTNGIVMTAVIFAGLTAIVLLGPYHYFGTSQAEFPQTLSSWMAILVCGVVGGLLGGLFARSLVSGASLTAPLLQRFPYRVALVCGLLVALFGWISDFQANGTGYDVAKSIIQNEGDFEPLMPLWKFGATVASYLSGIPGGIFAPSLAAGAGVGADLANWLPIAPVATMVLLGMVGYFCGVVQSPITAFVIVMEMTNDNAMMLPLMATSLVAYAASRFVCPTPIYHSLAQVFLKR